MITLYFLRVSRPIVATNQLKPPSQLYTMISAVPLTFTMSQHSYYELRVELSTRLTIHDNLLSVDARLWQLSSHHIAKDYHHATSTRSERSSVADPQPTDE